ncbi:MAG: ParB/RepB/Spo0J family partition protein [Clostridiales bacterium]|nr:ParB/RepB/Spo0J family partition protein [Clostridiales bacterium]HBM80795.1 chromosome partitioning protein ParB [Clostridiaceae bacterium]
MANKKPALGRGLEALIPDIEPEVEGGITEIDINEIQPNKEQPRKKFDEDKLKQLAESIKEHGVVQPVIVKKEGEFYSLIAGERRWRAARIAGIRKIPAIIKDFTNNEVMEISLIENLQREDLNPIEEAEAYARLINEFNMTQEDIANKIGKSRSAVANILRLINLDERVRKFVYEDVLSEGHARALINIDDKDVQYETAKKIIDENLNVRQSEKLVKKILLSKIIEKRRKPQKKNEPYINDIQEKLKNHLGTKVRVTYGRKKGKIEIEYYSYDDLERLMNLLNI